MRATVMVGFALAVLLGLAGACQEPSRGQAGGAAAPRAPAAAPSAAAVQPERVKVDELERGSGEEVRPGRTAVVHYTGWLAATGRKFDSSHDRGPPIEFVVGRGMVIPGWEQGVAGMRVGGKRRLLIPPGLAYGDRGAGEAIPPGSALVFEVELVGLK